MLTKYDLQAIGALVETIIDRKLEEKLDPIREDTKSIKNDINYMKGTLRSVIELHGSELNSHEKRIDRLETKVFTPGSFKG
jgi:uncharacterized Fe-S cluster-containing protein